MAQEKLETMLMQNFGVTNKEYYGMLRYFLEWSIVLIQVYNCDGSGTTRSRSFPPENGNQTENEATLYNIV